MEVPKDIAEYLKTHAVEMGARILEMYPPLHNAGDPVSPWLQHLRRKPYAAQVLAILGLLRRFQQARTAALVAECGAGKTLVSLSSIFAHSEGKPFTALAMVPPQLVKKWSRECFQTLPHVRVFVIDGLRNGCGSNGWTGVNEVRLRHGEIVREGLQTTLSELRLRRDARSARARWQQLCSSPSVFVLGRDKGKLSYFWKHAYQVAHCGRFRGCVINSDTGEPVFIGENRVLRDDFKKARLSEIIGKGSASTYEDARLAEKARRQLFSALWQADRAKLGRYAPVEFIGRFMDRFFDYAIADEVHELKGGDTAQGNALGTLAACAERILILTGTLLGGYADELYHILFRLEAKKMLSEGFEHGDAGARAFTETYGVMEKVTIIEPEDNACSKARLKTQIRRRPGASPLLFGRFLMSLGAFVSLEDISDALPPYEEEVVKVEMDPALGRAYERLEKEIQQALKEHRGNQSVMSVALNALMLYPDRPFRMGTLSGYEFNPETQRREPFLIAEPEDLPEDFVYAKERRLVEEVKKELRGGTRCCLIYAVYTQKRDVTRRLERILVQEGIWVAILTTEVAPELREAWYQRQLRAGVQAILAHPKLLQTGLDLVECNAILFYETGYSIYTLRQASRRSWRIGQRKPVRVKFLHYAGTVQEACLRLMGKKLLISLAMEGKFSSAGLQSMDDDGDILMSMARELVTEKRIGESADQVWKMVQKQQGEIMRRAETDLSTNAAQGEDLLETDPLPPSTWMTTQTGSDGHEEKGVPGANQLTLF